MIKGKLEDFIYKLNEFGQYDHELVKEEPTENDENVQQTTEPDIIKPPTQTGVNMTKYDKQTLQTLLQDDSYVNEAIRLLGQNQTAGELRTKSTHNKNDIGFSAAYGRTGTRLYEFVTGIETRTDTKKWAPKSLSHPVANKVFSRYISNHGLNNALELGRKIALVHWRQLEALTQYQPQSLPSTQTTKKEKKPVQKLTFEGVEVIDRKGKAVKVRFDSRYIWLPTSQIEFDSTTDTLTLPVWLAKNKQMAS